MMNLAQLKSSRALWLRRERYRHKKWAFYRYKSQRPLDERMKYRAKWWTLYEEARNARVNRDRQIASFQTVESPRAVAVAWAASKIGITESPPNSNRGPEITAWQRSFGDWLVGQPWCGVFCGRALVQAHVKGVTSRIAGVALIEDDARAGRAPFRSWHQSAKGSLRGDLVVIGGRGVHVELIEQVNADGSVISIGGNTSPGFAGSQSNGGGVWRRHRSVSEIHGVARVAYR